MRKTTDEELSILKWTENTRGHPRTEDCRDIAEYDIVRGAKGRGGPVQRAAGRGGCTRMPLHTGCTLAAGRVRAQAYSVEQPLGAAECACRPPPRPPPPRRC